MEQSEKFSGFEEDDFKIFEIQGLKERIKEIKKRIHPKLKLLELEVLKHFENDPEVTVPLYPHYPKHPNRKNLPSATWLAFGRYPYKYVNYAQLNVGLSKQFGVMIRLGFTKGKKSVDFPKFKKYIAENENRKYLEKLNSGFVFFLGRECVKNKELLYKMIRETPSIDEALRPISLTSATWFEIGKQYDRNDDIVRSEELANEVITVFGELYPIYREIGQAK